MPHVDPFAVYAEDLDAWRLPAEPPRVTHSVHVSVAQTRCGVCGGKATHKVAEQCTSGALHAFSAWLCCEHFQWIGCDCSTYPYDLKPPKLTGGDLDGPE